MNWPAQFYHLLLALIPSKISLDSIHFMTKSKDCPYSKFILVEMLVALRSLIKQAYWWNRKRFKIGPIYLKVHYNRKYMNLGVLHVYCGRTNIQPSFPRMHYILDFHVYWYQCFSVCRLNEARKDTIQIYLLHLEYTTYTKGGCHEPMESIIL